MKRSIKYIVLMATLTGCLVTFGQSKKGGGKPATRHEEEKKDDLNKTDNLNRKQGLWFYKHEAAMGEPLTYEFGSYLNNKKEGVWTTLDANQQLVSTENFNKGVLNGTSQYYDQGRLICIGNYRGLNQDKKIDSIWVTDPDTYNEHLVGIPTEQGYTRHGSWRYYDAVTGQLTREEEYQVDDLIYRKEYHFISQTDSLKRAERSQRFLSQKKYAQPPAGKGRSLIQ